MPRRISKAELRYRQPAVVGWGLLTVSGAVALLFFFLNERFDAPLYASLELWIGVSCFLVLARADLTRPAALASPDKVTFFPSMYGDPVEIRLSEVETVTQRVNDFEFQLKSGDVVAVRIARFRVSEIRRFRSDLAHFSEHGSWPVPENAAQQAAEADGRTGQRN